MTTVTAEKITANISGIIKSSVIDGPGNRLVIFFQGCQLNCLYCHNSHTIGLCNMCGICVENCPTWSLSTDTKTNRVINNRESCIRCDKCIEMCPQSSNPFYSRYTIEELIREILPVRDFISGITVSGGEAMLHQPFLVTFFKTIREHPDLNDISIFVDSNGHVDTQQWEPLLNLTDGFMIDMKAITSSIHKEITGHDNDKILKSIAYLDSADKLYEIRTVIVPGLNDTGDEILKLTSLYKTLSPKVNKVLIKMRKHGVRQRNSSLKYSTDKEMKQILEQIGDSTIRII